VAFGSSPAPGWYPDPWWPAQLRYWDGHAWTVERQPGWYPDPWGPAQLRYWDGNAWTRWTVKRHRRRVDPLVATIIAAAGLGGIVFVVGLLSTAIQSCSQGDQGMACDRSGYSDTAFFLGVAGCICVAGIIWALVALFRARHGGLNRVMVYAAMTLPFFVLAAGLGSVWSSVSYNRTWDGTPINPDTLAHALRVGTIAGAALGVVGAALLLALQRGHQRSAPEIGGI
jgi:hypothetical protein